MTSSFLPLRTTPLALALMAGLATTGYTPLAHAGLTTLTDPSGQVQCGASDINNSMVAVGNCSPMNDKGPTQAFFNQGGATTALSPLATGQSCRAEGVANNGDIIGECVDGSNRPSAVKWRPALSPAPAPLQPMQGLLGLTPDVTDTATGFNQLGAVIGDSESATAMDTAVIWPAGSTTATLVSNPDDNCIAVDVNDNSASAPPVALDCPNAAGTMTGKIAQATGLLGAYVATALPLPRGTYTHCTVAGINNSKQAVGTCHIPAPDLPVAVFWATPTSTPTLLPAPILNGTAARTSGAFINNSGHVVFTYQNANGNAESGLWIPGGSVTLIPPLSGGTRAMATGLADNDRVPLVSENASENSEAAYWSPGTGDVDEGQVNSGKNSALTAINQAGTAAVGSGEGSAQNSNAVEVAF